MEINTELKSIEDFKTQYPALFNSIKKANILLILSNLNIVSDIDAYSQDFFVIDIDKEKLKYKVITHGNNSRDSNEPYIRYIYFSDNALLLSLIHDISRLIIKYSGKYDDRYYNEVISLLMSEKYIAFVRGIEDNNDMETLIYGKQIDIANHLYSLMEWNTLLKIASDIPNFNCIKLFLLKRGQRDYYICVDIYSKMFSADVINNKLKELENMLEDILDSNSEILMNEILVSMEILRDSLNNIKLNNKTPELSINDIDKVIGGL